jgi:4-amino-4-deoxy-L-arabinose transferase-like glycosyltransferase
LTYGLFGLILLTGAYLLLYKLPEFNLNPDETIYTISGLEYMHGTFTGNLVHPFVAKYVFGLAQLIGGPGIATARYAAALATLAGGVVLFYWLKTIHPAAGLVAAAVWLLVPRALSPDMGPRIDRFAILEPVLCFFIIATLALVWFWAQTGRWRWACLAGIVGGLATGAKLSGAVVVVVGLVFAAVTLGWRAWLQGLVFGAISVVTFVATFLPADDVLGRVGLMLSQGSGHAANGHEVDLAGGVYLHAPWWGILWQTGAGIGPACTAALVICLVLVAALLIATRRRPSAKAHSPLAHGRRLLRGPGAGEGAQGGGVPVGEVPGGEALSGAPQSAPLRRELAQLAVLGLVTLVTFWALQTFVVRIALGHYYVILLVPLTLLCAAGLTWPWLTARAGQPGAWTVVGRALAALAAGLFAVGIGQSAVEVADTRPTGMARVMGELAQRHRPAQSFAITGATSWEWKSYLPAEPPANSTDSVDAILVERHWLRFRPEEGILDFIAKNRACLELVQLDTVEMYIPTTTPQIPLTTPTWCPTQ